MGLSDFLGALLKIGGDLYSSSAHECAIGELSRSDGGVGFYQNLFSCFLIPLRRKLSFFRFLPFNPSPRRYRSSVSKHRGEGIIPTAVTKLGILLSLPCSYYGVSRIDRNRGEVGILLDLPFCVSLRGVYKERAANRQLFLYDR